MHSLESITHSRARAFPISKSTRRRRMRFRRSNHFGQSEPLKAARFQSEIFPQLGLRSNQVHLLHLLVLRPDREPVHVHRNRNYDFGTTTAGASPAGTATSSRSAVGQPVRVQTGLDPFPLGASILEPDFNLPGKNAKTTYFIYSKSTANCHQPGPRSA